MVVTTTDTYSKPYTELGLVYAALQSGKFVSMKSMDKQIEASLEQAQAELIEQAAEMGADAVIGLRISWMNGQMLAMGTAIKQA